MSVVEVLPIFQSSRSNFRVTCKRVYRERLRKRPHPCNMGWMRTLRIKLGLRLTHRLKTIRDREFAHRE